MADETGVPRSWRELREAGLVRLIREPEEGDGDLRRARVHPAGDWHNEPNKYSGLSDQVYDSIVIEGSLALALALKERYGGAAAMWCFVCCEIDTDAYAALSEIASTRAPILGLDFAFDGAPQMMLTAWAFALTDASWPSALAQADDILRSDWLVFAAVETSPTPEHLRGLFRNGLQSGSVGELGMSAAVSLSNWAEVGRLVCIRDEALFHDFGVEAGS